MSVDEARMLRVEVAALRAELARERDHTATAVADYASAIKERDAAVKRAEAAESERDDRRAEMEGAYDVAAKAKADLAAAREESARLRSALERYLVEHSLRAFTTACECGMCRDARAAADAALERAAETAEKDDRYGGVLTAHDIRTLKSAPPGEAKELCVYINCPIHSAPAPEKAADVCPGGGQPAIIPAYSTFAPTNAECGICHMRVGIDAGGRCVTHAPRPATPATEPPKCGHVLSMQACIKPLWHAGLHVYEETKPTPRLAATTEEPIIAAPVAGGLRELLREALPYIKRGCRIRHPGIGDLLARIDAALAEVEPVMVEPAAVPEKPTP